MTERMKFLFVGDIPLLYPERNVDRQFITEMRFDMTPLYKALNLKSPEQIADEKRRGYVV